MASDRVFKGGHLLRSIAHWDAACCGIHRWVFTTGRRYRSRAFPMFEIVGELHV